MKFIKEDKWSHINDELCKKGASLMEVYSKNSWHRRCLMVTIYHQTLWQSNQTETSERCSMRHISIDDNALTIKSN